MNAVVIKQIAIDVEIILSIQIILQVLIFLNINQYVHRGILIVYVIRLILSVIIHCIIKILMEI